MQRFEVRTLYMYYTLVIGKELPVHASYPLMLLGTSFSSIYTLLLGTSFSCIYTRYWVQVSAIYVT